MIKEIKFKNDYEKLPFVWNNTQAPLICCYPTTLLMLKRGLTAFFNKDTKIRGEKTDFYPITESKLLVLVFIHHNTGELISTIRSNTVENFELYINSLGETFKFIKK